MRGSERKERKRKQLRLWKWGISMQGELYLEEPCQVKNIFFKTIPHIIHIQLNLRTITTTINTNSY